jgi:hypothetical protein
LSLSQDVECHFGMLQFITRLVELLSERRASRVIVRQSGECRTEPVQVAV